MLTVRGLEREKKMKQPMTATAGQLGAIEQAGRTRPVSPQIRVAAYIRVSTALDIQENSFEVKDVF